MNPSIPPYEGSGFLGQDLIVEDVLGTPPLMNQSLMGGRGDFQIGDVLNSPATTT